MMFATTLLALTLLAPSQGDTVILQAPRAFLWMRRPAVNLVLDSPDQVTLTITARDPQYFAGIKLELHTTTDLHGASVAELSTDSSAVDARSDTHRHTLIYHLTGEQLGAWAAGSAPTLHVGTITVTLDAAGRQALSAAAQRTRPNTP